MCSGIVYPFAFYQLEMQAGILNASMSSLVNFRGGDLMMTGGSPSGALMIFLCLWRGGSSGSHTVLDIWIMRCMPGCYVLEVVGVYLTKVSSSFCFMAEAYKKEFSVFFAIFIPNSYLVFSRFFSLFSWLGLDKSAFYSAV